MLPPPASFSLTASCSTFLSSIGILKLTLFLPLLSELRGEERSEEPLPEEDEEEKREVEAEKGGISISSTLASEGGRETEEEEEGEDRIKTLRGVEEEEAESETEDVNERGLRFSPDTLLPRCVSSC